MTGILPSARRRRAAFLPRKSRFSAFTVIFSAITTSYLLNKQRRNACLVMYRSDRRSEQFSNAQNFDLPTILERPDIAAERDSVGNNHFFQMRIRNILCRVSR